MAAAAALVAVEAVEAYVCRRARVERKLEAMDWKLPVLLVVEAATYLSPTIPPGHDAPLDASASGINYSHRRGP